MTAAPRIAPTAGRACTGDWGMLGVLTNELPGMELTRALICKNGNNGEAFLGFSQVIWKAPGVQSVLPLFHDFRAEHGSERL